MKTTARRRHVGTGLGSRIAGVSPAVLLRLALVGDLDYTVSPDKRPLFAVSELERLRDTLRHEGVQAP